MPLLPGSGYFFVKKAQHILICRASGTMFRHHNNHIVIYSIGKVIRLSNFDIFKFNHNLCFSNYRILPNNKLLPIIILTTNDNLHAFIHICQEVQTVCSNQAILIIQREPHQRGLGQLQHSYLRYIAFHHFHNNRLRRLVHNSNNPFYLK